jgi:hypothetical protein
MCSGKKMLAASFRVESLSGKAFFDNEGEQT